MTHNERVLQLLSDGKPHSHHELYGLHVIAHSRVADLRKRGHAIEQWREGDLYLYRLISQTSAGEPRRLPTSPPLRGQAAGSDTAAAVTPSPAEQLTLEAA